MKQFIIFFTFIFAFPLSSYGGNSSAGGDGVIINGKPYLLDFVEANIHEEIYIRNPEDYSPLVAQTISDQLRIDIETSRLIAAKLSEIYDKNVVMEFLIKWRMLHLDWLIVPRKLIHVRDEDTVLEFNDYELVQLAVRQDSTIYINQDQWGLLDVVNRAGLIIHEVMYALRDAFNNNDHYSPPARRLTSLFFDKRSETMTRGRFHFLLNREGLLFSSPLTNGNVLFVDKYNIGDMIKEPHSVIFGSNEIEHRGDPFTYSYQYLYEHLPGYQIMFASASCSSKYPFMDCLPILRNWPDGSNNYEKAQNYFKAVLDGDARTDHRVYQKGDIF